MAELNDMVKLMDELLPDQKVKDDLAKILWSDGDAKVEIEENEWVTIPVNCELAITTKAFFREYYTLNFGPFKAQVAVGGVEKQSHGILYAKYCFALLFYNEQFQNFTVDFYKHMG